MAIASDNTDMHHSTTVICNGKAHFIGLKIRDPTNLTMDEDPTPDDRVFTSARPLDGFAISASRTERRRRSSGGSDSSSPATSTKITASKSPNTELLQACRVGQPPHLSQLISPSSLTISKCDSISPFAARPVTLVVGPNHTPDDSAAPTYLMAHENLLTEISSFFRAALSRPKSGYSFQEAHSGIIRLPDERPEDIAFLLQWAYWRSLVSPHCVPNSTGMIPPGYPPANLYHHAIDPHIHRYKKWLDEKKLLKQTFGPASSEVRAFKKQRKRPKPPAFGPLIRLYIIADKFDVQKGSREQIMQRVKEVAKQANCVPDAEDVGMLWENVMGEREGLKKEVVGLFAELDVRSLTSLFAGGRVGDAVGDYEDEVDKWHPVFVRDLLLEVVGRREREPLGVKIDAPKNEGVGRERPWFKQR